MYRIIAIILVLMLATPAYADVYDTSGNLTAAGVSPGTCVLANGAGVATSRPAPCSPTGQAFVIPAVGSNVTVTTQNLNFSYFLGQPITITDGTNTVIGSANATVTNSTTFSFHVFSVNNGLVGNTMAAGSNITTGGAGVIGANRILHDTFTTASTANNTCTSATITFSLAFTNTPTVVVSISTLPPVASSHTSDVAAYADTKTNTNFVIHFCNNATGTFSSTIDWIATGV
jgi:hypothetical protein